MKNVKEKKERSLGIKLFLKAERCNSPKCATVRKPYRAGMHGQKRRRAISDYGRQLQEKQKVMLIYGLNNRQMLGLFKDSSPAKIYSVLEKRLDRVVYYLGFAPSPRVGRQMVSHGHIMVNGRKVTIPSFSVKIGDKISIRPESKSSKLFEGAGERIKQVDIPSWLKIDPEKMIGECVALPSVEGVQLPFDLSLVGEFYSR
ncbi:30S ribosomal protein S4 [Patescibacteria group bacterium]|nr:30S ribosomal protein S4 [Patescibacteria group bacterium]